MEGRRAAVEEQGGLPARAPGALGTRRKRRQQAVAEVRCMEPISRCWWACWQCAAAGGCLALLRLAQPLCTTAGCQMSVGVDFQDRVNTGTNCQAKPACLDCSCCHCCSSAGLPVSADLCTHWCDACAVPALQGARAAGAAAVAAGRVPAASLGRAPRARGGGWRAGATGCPRGCGRLRRSQVRQS